jgi:polyisoprenoid-binding protein YceI
MTNWNIDADHSSLEFSVRHMGFSTVRGRFRSFSGFVQTDDNDVPQDIEVTIETASIDTGVENRDTHLRSADFFEADKYPEITFRSTAIEQVDMNNFKVTGQLDMHGHVNPITFTVNVENPIKDPYGLTRSAAMSSSKLNRKDWGLNWNQLLEACSMLVSDNVSFNFVLEVVKQA